MKCHVNTLGPRDHVINCALVKNAYLTPRGHRVDAYLAVEDGVSLSGTRTEWQQTERLAGNRSKLMSHICGFTMLIGRKDTAIQTSRFSSPYLDRRCNMGALPTTLSRRRVLACLASSASSRKSMLDIFRRNQFGLSRRATLCLS